MLVLAGNNFFSSLALKFFVDFRHPVSEFGAQRSHTRVNRNQQNKIKNGFQQEKQGETDEITGRGCVRAAAETQLHVLHSAADDRRELVGI